MVEQILNIRNKYNDELEKKELLLENLNNKFFSLATKVFNKGVIDENERRKEQLQKEIIKLKQKIDKLNIALEKLNLFDIMDLCTEYGIKAVLTDEDKKYIPNKERTFESLDDVILIHRSNHCPTDNTLYSSANGGNYIDVNDNIGDYTYSFKVKKGRNTVHFCANHEVKEHLYGNNWNSQKYAVIIPFNDLDKTKIRQACPIDTFVEGNVALTPNSIIIAPDDEVEEIKKNNPICHVVGYDGIAMDTAHTVISWLGYQTFAADQNHLLNYETAQKYDQLMKSNGFSTDMHSNTFEYVKENLDAVYTHITNTIEKYQEGYEDKKIDDISLLRDKITNSANRLVGLSMHGTYNKFSIDSLFSMLDADYNTKCKEETYEYYNNVYDLTGEEFYTLIKIYMNLLCQNIDTNLKSKVCEKNIEK